MSKQRVPPLCFTGGMRLGCGSGRTQPACLRRVVCAVLRCRTLEAAASRMRLAVEACWIPCITVAPSLLSSQQEHIVLCTLLHAR